MILINNVRYEDYSVVDNRVAIRMNPGAAPATVILDGKSRRVTSVTKSLYVPGVVILALA